MEDAPIYDYDLPGYNNTEDEENTNLNIFRTTQILEVICYSITFILGIIGNGLVIWIVGFKMEKTVSSLWFLNLAIADFVFVMILPLQVTDWIVDKYWPFGRAMCKIVFTVLFLNMSVSASFLMIISVDRCTTILCPVWSKNHRSPRLASVISVIVWTICFMLNSPYLAFLDIEHDYRNSRSFCIAIYSDDHDIYEMRYQTMMIIRFLSMFILPFLVIITCYSIILSRLKRSRSLSRSNKPLKVIITVVLCFYCFCFPFHAWHLLEFLGVDMNNTGYFIMSNFVYCILIFNSCVNPIVYVFVGRDYKKILFKSIPFLLENTLKEKEDSDTGPRSPQTTVEAEMESFNL